MTSTRPYDYKSDITEQSIPSVDAVQEEIKGLGKKVGDFFNRLKPQFNEFLNNLQKELGVSETSKASELGQRTKKTATEYYDKPEALKRDFHGKIKEAQDYVYQNIEKLRSSNDPELVKKYKDQIQEAYESFSKRFGDLIPKSEELGERGAIGSRGLERTMRGSADPEPSANQQIMSKLQEAFQEFTSKIKEVPRQASRGDYGETIKTGNENIMKKLEELNPDKLKEYIADYIERSKRNFQGLPGNASEYFEKGTQRYREPYLNDVSDKFGQKKKQLAESNLGLEDIYGKLQESVKGMSEGTGSLKEQGMKTAGELKSFISLLLEKMKRGNEDKPLTGGYHGQRSIRKNFAGKDYDEFTEYGEHDSFVTNDRSRRGTSKEREIDPSKFQVFGGRYDDDEYSVDDYDLFSTESTNRRGSDPTRSSESFRLTTTEDDKPRSLRRQTGSRLRDEDDDDNNESNVSNVSKGKSGDKSNDKSNKNKDNDKSNKNKNNDKGIRGSNIGTRKTSDRSRKDTRSFEDFELFTNDDLSGRSSLNDKKTIRSSLLSDAYSRPRNPKIDDLYRGFLKTITDSLEVDESKARIYRYAIKYTIEKENPDLKGRRNDEKKVEKMADIINNKSKLRKMIDSIDFKEVDRFVEQRKKESEARQSNTGDNKRTRNDTKEENTEDSENKPVRRTGKKFKVAENGYLKSEEIIFSPDN